MSESKPENTTAVAQLVEQRFPKPQVAGSSPSRRDSAGNGGEQPPTSRDFGGGAGGRRWFGIYKFGQGYWVRIGTALAIGIFAMLAAAWAANELEAYQPPAPTWSLPLSEMKGAPQAGAAVVLQALEDNKPVQIGTATAGAFEGAGTDSGALVVREIKITDTNRTARDVQRIEAGPAGTPSVVALVSRPVPIPLFPRGYVQAGVAGLLLLAGMIVGWRLVASKPSAVDFLIATDGEMKKVNWSTRKVIIDTTSVVIFATFFIAFLIFVFDFGLRLLVQVTKLM